MSTISVMQEFVESLRSTATVKSVFGEPIQTEGKTVVPIAKVGYGFGLVSGTRQNPGRVIQTRNRKAKVEVEVVA